MFGIDAFGKNWGTFKANDGTIGIGRLKSLLEHGAQFWNPV
jgi:hypothetical protein